MSGCKADPASAGPGSSDMEEQGGGGERGGQRPWRLPIKHDADVVQIAKIMRGGEGDAVKGICVGGGNRLSKVCGGCNVQRAGLTVRCWGRGSTELDGRLEVPNCLDFKENLESETEPVDSWHILKRESGES